MKKTAKTRKNVTAKPRQPARCIRFAHRTLTVSDVVIHLQEEAAWLHETAHGDLRVYALAGAVRAMAEAVVLTDARETQRCLARYLLTLLPGLPPCRTPSVAWELAGMWAD